MKSTFDYNTYEGFLSEEADTSPLLDSLGRYKTKGLFAEGITRDQILKGVVPLYTMRDKEKKFYAADGSVHVLPSAYQIYMHSVDETEAALKLVGSLKHWRTLVRQHPDGSYLCKWFMHPYDEKGCDGLLQWREDMRARDSMMAKRSLMKLAEEGNVAAAKAVHQLGISEAKKTLNRNARLRKETSATLDEQTMADLARLGVIVEEAVNE